MDTWDKSRLNEYQLRLGRIAAWVKAKSTGPAVNAKLRLPIALDNLVTHGPMESIVTPTGQVILLIQFYDFNLSTDSTGVVYANPPLSPAQLCKTSYGGKTIDRSGIWTIDLQLQVTPKIWRAELDESQQWLNTPGPRKGPASRGATASRTLR